MFAYTIIGGYLSVVVTDFIQGLLMFFALAVVFIGSVASAGGIDNTVAFLKGIPGFLDGTHVATPILNDAGEQIVKAGQAMFGAPADYGIITIISMLAWGLGYFGMPQVLVRFLSIRSSEEIKKSRIIATTWCVISLACGVCIGLVGRAMMPTQFDTQAAAENIFIVVSQALLPSFMCGIVVSGIFAASMSSSSSYMIIGASAVGENIFRGLLHRKATDRQVMMVARITLLVMFIFGIVVAFDQNSSIFQVVSYAWAGLGASFGPLMLTSLYWRRTNKYGAIAGMLSGTATVLIWHNLVKPLGGIFAIYELLPAFIVSLLFIVVVSLLRPRQARKCCTNSTTISTIRTTATWTTTSWPPKSPQGRSARRSESPRGGCCTSCNAEGRPLVPCRLFMADSDNREMSSGLFVAPDSGTPCMSIGIPTDIHGVSRFPCHK